jgi:hypothetical protein
MDSKNMTLIGHFSVDSGQAMVGDPCYLDNWKHWNDKTEDFELHKKKAGEYGYLGACGSTIAKGYGELGMSTAVVFSTGYGDGIYPVYAELDEDGRVAKILIEFIEDEDSE